MSVTVTNLQIMRNYFESGATKPYQFRKEQLQKLKKAVLKHEQDISDALYKDLHKSPEEAWLTETGMVLSEINYFLKRMNKLMKPKKVPTNIINMPGQSYIMPEPLGVVLIIAPWNYPFQLLVVPLIGAIAAGNCVMLKPSEFASHTEKVMQELIADTFDEKYVSCTTGNGALVVPEMMENFTFDHVFFTGGTGVGKKIYQMAAEKLVPVTLELGGKSPCVITENANLSVAAKRIAFTKFSNAGQMCIAPDYLLVHHSVTEKLIRELTKTIPAFLEQMCKTVMILAALLISSIIKGWWATWQMPISFMEANTTKSNGSSVQQLLKFAALRNRLCRRRYSVPYCLL